MVEPLSQRPEQADRANAAPTTTINFFIVSSLEKESSQGYLLRLWRTQ
jgi:hypothetical protein